MKRKENKIKTIFFMLLTICMMTVLMHDSVSASNVRLNRTQVQIVRGDTYSKEKGNRCHLCEGKWEKVCM